MPSFLERAPAGISGHILCSVEVPRIQYLGNTYVLILDFVVKSQVRKKNESGAASRGERTRAWVSAGYRSKLPEPPPTFLEIVFKLFWSLFEKISCEFVRVRNRSILSKKPGL